MTRKYSRFDDGCLDGDESHGTISEKKTPTKQIQAMLSDRFSQGIPALRLGGFRGVFQSWVPK